MSPLEKSVEISSENGYRIQSVAMDAFVLIHPFETGYGAVFSATEYFSKFETKAPFKKKMEIPTQCVSCDYGLIMSSVKK